MQLPHSLCPCSSEDPYAADDALKGSHHVAELLDESHLGVRLIRCKLCDRPFLSVFTELVDWTNSDDSQAWITVMLTEGEARALESEGAAANWRGLMASLGADRRHLARVWPRGGTPGVSWHTGPAPVLPHD